MIGTDAEVLARLRLVQGHSNLDLREFAKSRSQTAMLTVGSSADCDWRVQETGVAPIHFSLHWDGATLRIADTHGTGSVRIDGEIVGAEWRRLAGRSRIDFGRAGIVVEVASSYPDYGSGHKTVLMSDLGAPFAGSSPRSVRPPSTDHSSGSSTTQLGIDGARRGGKHNGETTLAFVDQRTMQGYAPVQVPQTSTLARADSSAHVAVQKTRQVQIINDESSNQAELVHTPAPTSMVIYRGDQADHGVIQAAQASETTTYVHQRERLPKAVCVLSPIAHSPPEIVERPASIAHAQRHSQRPPLSWRSVAFGWLAFLGGYAGWLYLLYNL